AAAAGCSPASRAGVLDRGVALAAPGGRWEAVRMVPEAGEHPSRYNPPTNHSHSTPLHQAVISGRDAIVRLLVERGARLDIRDTIYNGTPLGWAEYCDQPAIATYLRTQGAPQ